MLTYGALLIVVQQCAFYFGTVKQRCFFFDDKMTPLGLLLRNFVVIDTLEHAKPQFITFGIEIVYQFKHHNLLSRKQP